MQSKLVALLKKNKHLVEGRKSYLVEFLVIQIYNRFQHRSVKHRKWKTHEKKTTTKKIKQQQHQIIKFNSNSQNTRANLETQQLKIRKGRSLRNIISQCILATALIILRNCWKYMSLIGFTEAFICAYERHSYDIILDILSMLYSIKRVQTPHTRLNKTELFRRDHA